jgi:2-polyprenyl-3-methyl-5-hydroxy-6-metoxy-1,4-benzoquinol methylase
MKGSSMQAPTETKQEKRFDEKLLDIYNGAATTLMISVGHRTGLFDKMAEIGAASSEQLAAAASLNERYVREWLGALTVSGVVKYDETAKRYLLPPDHAHLLIRKSGKDNLAVFAQYVSVLGNVEDEIIECFRKGGGVPYSSYKRFHEVMAEDSGQSLVPALLENVLPLVDGLVAKMEQGIDVMDIGCGRGLALMRMAKAFPKSKFVGYDLCDETIAYANKEAKIRQLANLTFEVRDVSALNDVEKFDFITAFDAIHDQAQPQVVLDNISKALKADGTFLMQDIDASSHVEKNLDHPLGPFLYTISCMHCMTVSLAQNGEGLGTMWGRETAQTYLKRAGFNAVVIHKLHHDIQNCIYVAAK